MGKAWHHVIFFYKGKYKSTIENYTKILYSLKTNENVPEEVVTVPPLKP